MDSKWRGGRNFLSWSGHPAPERGLSAPSAAPGAERGRNWKIVLRLNGKVSVLENTVETMKGKAHSGRKYSLGVWLPRARVLLSEELAAQSEEPWAETWRALCKRWGPHALKTGSVRSHRAGAEESG